jgi:replication-associated recombination protein RarA
MSLFTAQAGLAFPASLSEKYRPHVLDSFIGLDKPKRVLARFAEAPFETAFLFVGASGTGKTSMALALAERLNAEVHHIPSQKCTASEIDDTVRRCWYVPNGSFHLCIVDEADKMSNAAQLALLSKLDSTAKAPRTIWIFTCNATDGLEPRFLSRTMQLDFSSHGLAKEIAALLERVWIAEAGDTPTRPNFLRVAQDSKNNVRDSIHSLQVELLAI